MEQRPHAGLQQVPTGVSLTWVTSRRLKNQAGTATPIASHGSAESRLSVESPPIQEPTTTRCSNNQQSSSHTHP
jgi:hypothetical protein